jgi:hypothetical protein
MDQFFLCIFMGFSDGFTFFLRVSQLIRLWLFSTFLFSTSHFAGHSYHFRKKQFLFLFFWVILLLILLWDITKQRYIYIYIYFNGWWAQMNYIGMSDWNIRIPKEPQGGPIMAPMGYLWPYIMIAWYLYWEATILFSKASLFRDPNYVVTIVTQF